MAYRVRVQPSGHEFTVAEDETVLDAALRESVGLPYGCRNGTCGSCLGTVVEGEVDYGGELPPALGREEAALGKALFCQARPRSDLLIEAREVVAVQDLEVRMMPCRAEAVERLAHDVMLVKLRLPATQRLQFLAGQYLEFVLRDGRRRAFSIANAPHADELIELHIRHVPGGSFTDHVFAELKAKALLRIEAPLGSFFLREDSNRPILLVGGGTGFAPLKAIVEHAFHIQERRAMHLFWGVRAKRDLYLDDLPREWSQRHPLFRYTPVLSEPRPEDAWEGETGWVTDAVARAYPDLGAYDIYVAGPPPMCDAAREVFLAHGARPEHMYSDAFEYAKDSRAAASGQV